MLTLCMFSNFAYFSVCFFLINLSCLCFQKHINRERSGSVVECLTGDRGVAGLSLNGVTVLCP